MKVLVTDKLSRAALLALVALGADVVTADTRSSPRRLGDIRPREDVGAWPDTLAMSAPEKQRRYGPPVKGRGGKLRRW